MKRIKSLFVASAFSTMVALMAVPADAQDLFSRERLSGNNVRGTSGTNRLDTRELERVIERAGYRVEDVHNDELIEITVEEGEWTLPVFVELSPDQSNMWVTVVLHEFAGPLDDHAENLARLMAENGKYGNVFFKLDMETRMIMLMGSKANEELTPASVDEFLVSMGAIAVEYENIWRQDEAPVEMSPAQQLVGTWMHSEDGRSLELNFRNNGRFTATVSQDGETSTFSGTFEATSRQIDLVTDELEEFPLPIVSMTDRALAIDLDGVELVLTRR